MRLFVLILVGVTVLGLGGTALASTGLMSGLELRDGMSPVEIVLLITVGCWFLEDPTSVAVGLLVREGELTWWLAATGVFIGIFSGDLLLYGLGRILGTSLLSWRSVQRRLPARGLESLAEWFDRKGWSIILVSRFVPGMRLPVYLAAGAVGRRPGRMALWTLLAVALWTMSVLLVVVLLGEGLWAPLERVFGNRWVAFVVAVILFIVLVRIIMAFITKEGRRRLSMRAGRLCRWEFWPAWAIYGPMIPWLIWLWIRYRGPGTITCANPGMKRGGFLGESKTVFLARIPERWRAVGQLLPAGDVEARATQLSEIMQTTGMTWPVVLKPNQGERGSGVRCAQSETHARSILESNRHDILVQQCHPGPYEAGVFYIRRPDEDHGRIYSITDKFFPYVTGDGVTTIESLVLKDRRLRLQFDIFRCRHQQRWNEQLAEGQRLRLAFAGNHCQGTMFRDGTHLWAKPLEERIDQIAQSMEGFYYGRFDIMYSDADAFRAGEDLTIIEVNGSTSESTNIYDPSFSPIKSWRILANQLAWGYRIGHVFRKRGARPVTLRTMVTLVWRSKFGDLKVPKLSD